MGDLAEWNAAAGQAWNRLRLGLSRLCPFEYFRVVEVQKRRALHLQVLVWSAEPLPRGEVQELALATRRPSDAHGLRLLRTRGSR